MVQIFSWHADDIQKETRTRHEIACAFCYRLAHRRIAPMPTLVQTQEGKWSTARIATEGAYVPWNFARANDKLEGFPSGRCSPNRICDGDRSRQDWTVRGRE
jgi:hypothetical protein